MKLGLFGGTFDPIHTGHLLVAEWVRDELGLDRVDFVPAGDPWQKRERPVTEASLRAEMVQAAIEGNSTFGLERHELEERGPSYTVDTVRWLKAQPSMAQAEVYLLLGADAAAGIGSWKEADRLLELCRLVVIERPGTKVQVPAGAIAVEGPLVRISATGIRGRAAAGRSIRYLVPDPVRMMIEQLGLYAHVEAVTA